jgi:hypothetical protein
MRSFSSVLSTILIGFVVYIAQGYYRWVVHSTSPIEELGIQLHGYMPTPIQAWGCSRLRERFEGKSYPPYGCRNRASPLKWGGPEASQ